jgi:hypothetical protein
MQKPAQFAVCDNVGALAHCSMSGISDKDRSPGTVTLIGQGGPFSKFEKGLS